MPDVDVDRARASKVSLDAPGAEEVQVVPWPLLLRSRVLSVFRSPFMTLLPGGGAQARAGREVPLGARR